MTDSTTSLTPREDSWSTRRPGHILHDAAVLGSSVGGAWCHGAVARHRELHVPLLADFEPKGAVARFHGVSRSRDGAAGGRRGRARPRL